MSECCRTVTIPMEEYNALKENSKAFRAIQVDDKIVIIKRDYYNDSFEIVNGADKVNEKIVKQNEELVNDKRRLDIMIDGLNSEIKKMKEEYFNPEIFWSFIIILIISVAWNLFTLIHW